MWENTGFKYKQVVGQSRLHREALSQHIKGKNNTEHLVYDILINFIVIFGAFNSIYY